MKTENYGQLILIPTPIGDNGLSTMLPETINVIHRLRTFIVENARTARRFISRTRPPYKISDLDIRQLDKHQQVTPGNMLEPIFSGHDIGLMSEAGCPAIADPGSRLVSFAHKHDIRVRPLVGPSSILLALMASGLNGQQFAFHGYLPAKKYLLDKKLPRLESASHKSGATQVFIEAPYRNKQILESALNTLNDSTSLCVACNLTTESEYIRTRTIVEWRNEGVPDLHKQPAVFLLSAESS